MLNLPIESEIEVEHKVIRNFNMRQTVCLGISGAIAVIMYLIFHNWILMVAFTAPFALILMYFAKPGDNGEKAEDQLMKLAERHYYRNQVRIYRTENRYIPLMNRAYRRMRIRDQTDRELVQQMKRKQKEQARRRKRTGNKGIM